MWQVESSQIYRRARPCKRRSSLSDGRAAWLQYTASLKQADSLTVSSLTQDNPRSHLSYTISSKPSSFEHLNRSRLRWRVQLTKRRMRTFMTIPRARKVKRTEDPP